MSVEAVHDLDGIMCPQCAYFMPGRPSTVDLAGHEVHHRQAHHRAARFRNVPLTRSEVEGYVRLLEVYVHELERQASRHRGDIAERDEVIARLREPQPLP